MNKSFAGLAKRLLNLMYIFFPILMGITFLALFFDMYKYLGFFKKHFLIDSLTLFNLLLCLGLIVSIFPAKKNIPILSNLERRFERLNIVLLPLLIILYIYFNGLLAKKGFNYVFAEYHIQPQGIPLLIFFSAFVLFVFLYKGISDKTI